MVTGALQYGDKSPPITLGNGALNHMIITQGVTSALEWLKIVATDSETLDKLLFIMSYS